MINLVELLADGEDCAFDQPCKYGHRVEGHAVYCRNYGWVGGPRKCCRSWYWDEYNPNNEDSDYRCSGFAPNPDYHENKGDDNA